MPSKNRIVLLTTVFLCSNFRIFPQDVVYRINRRTRECTTSKPTSPFRRVEVPKNATYYGTYFVGSTSERFAGFKVNSFGGDTENGESFVSEFTCLSH